MFLISPVWAGVSVLAMWAIYRRISRHHMRERWGDVRSGAEFERARRSLLRLQDMRYHPKNWRPIIMALSGGAWSRLYLAVYGHWLAAGRGILSLAQVIVGRPSDLSTRRPAHERMLRTFIAEERLSAFPVAIVADDLPSGIRALVQGHGIGAVRPNTVMIGWTGNPEHYSSFGATLRTIADLEKGIVVVRCRGVDREEPWIAAPGTIDVWWRGRQNGDLMLLFAHLLSQNEEWRTRPIRLIRAIGSEAARGDAALHLQRLIDLSRIDATPCVIVADSIPEAIRQTSGEAAVVFLGFRPPAEGQESEFVGKMDDLAGDLSTVLFVSGAGDVAIEA